MSGGIPHWAVPGAKVVCVGWKRPAHWPTRICDIGLRWMPDIGGVYTISDVVWRDLYGPFLYLEENPNGHAQNFIAYAFRPVTRRTAEQDIAEHFAHHLTTPADRQGVDA